MRILRSPIKPAAPVRSRARRAVTIAPIKVLGVDASLSSTGYSYRYADGSICTGRVTTKKLDGPARLSYVASVIRELVVELRPDLVVYEDYAMSIGRGGRSFSIGELGGVLKVLFWDCGIDVMLVAPSALKKSITGRGDADAAVKVNGKKVKDPMKPMMRAALLNTFHIDLRQNDEADACGLMLMGEMRFGSHTVSVSTQRRLRLDTLRNCAIMKGRRAV